jgi:hypothetical protein
LSVPNSEFEIDTNADGVPDGWTFQPCVPGTVLITLEPYQAPAPMTVPPTPPTVLSLGSFNQNGVLMRNAGSANTCATLSSPWLTTEKGSTVLVSAAVRPHTQSNLQASLTVAECSTPPSCNFVDTSTVSFNRDDGYRVLTTKVDLRPTTMSMQLRYRIDSPAPSSLSLDDVRVIRIK